MVLKLKDGKRDEFEKVPFEEIDLAACNYSDLKSIEQQLKKSLWKVQTVIEDYEQDPEHDDEIGAYSESEYLRKMDEAEKRAWENSDI
jgi:hypothetical protein